MVWLIHLIKVFILLKKDNNYNMEKYVIPIVMIVSFITTILLLVLWTKDKDKLYEDD